MPIANYFISAVSFDGQGIITHVYLHLVYNDEKSFRQGVKTTEADAIQLIKNNNIIKTLVWNYTQASWNIGASVIVVKEQQKEFLRTKGDKTVRDNLDNLINMAAIIS